MKRIRNLIRNNIDQFDVNEPSPGHFEKFIAKLDTIHPVKNRLNIYKVSVTVISAAAIFILVFIVFKNEAFKGSPSSSEFSEEVKEMQMFYEHQIESNYKTLASFINCPVQKKEIQTCMEELNKSLKEIQEDIKENPGNEDMINVIVNHYRLKLEITDLMIDRARNYCF